MQWLLSLIGLTAAWFLWNCFTLFQNYLKARKSGFPVLICPSNPNNILWMVFSVPLRPLLWRLLPQWLIDRIKPSIYGWEFGDKGAAHMRMGPCFMVVNPGTIDLWIADPEVAWDVLNRRKNFVQLNIASLIMGQFGNNLITSNGDVWQRQRRLVAPNLNERISGIVWDETSKQTSEMADYFLNHKGGETNEAVAGMRLIAIHVLGQAAYGMPQPWKQEEKPPRSPGQRMTYIEAVSSVIEFLVPAAVLPSWILSLPIMPDKVRAVDMARRELPEYTKEMLEAERISSQSGERSNLMSMLVRLSDGVKNEEKTGTSQKAQYLNEDEICGNLFLFTAAGFDTTANTLGYTVILLAAYPEIQGWIGDEIDSVLGSKDEGQLEYSNVFPQMTRCMALMFEVLRLYTPLVHIARMSAGMQVVNRGADTFQIPDKTVVYVDAGLHWDSHTWGEDVLSFRPSRWVSEELGTTSLKSMPKGTFLPWSGGPRVCPGQKMAQVEFVAVIVSLLRTCRVLPVLEAGEDMNTARSRLLDITQDSQPRLTLQINRPKDVRLRFVKR